MKRLTLGERSLMNDLQTQINLNYVIEKHLASLYPLMAELKEQYERHVEQRARFNVEMPPDDSELTFHLSAGRVRNAIYGDKR